jgi:hypothetical protein
MHPTKVEDGQKITKKNGWTQSDNTKTTITRYNFMCFYVFKMAVTIAFLCKNAVEAIQIAQKQSTICAAFFIFYPIFHWGLYCKAVSITDNLCIKPGKSSIFRPKILTLWSRRVIIASVWYKFFLTYASLPILCTDSMHVKQNKYRTVASSNARY